MTTRDEVFKEFGRDEYVPADSWRMADEIVRLRQLLETVEAEREQAYQVAQQNEQTARRLGRILDALREPSEAVVKAVKDTIYEELGIEYWDGKTRRILYYAVAAAEQEVQP